MKMIDKPVLVSASEILEAIQCKELRVPKQPCPFDAEFCRGSFWKANFCGDKLWRLVEGIVCDPVACRLDLIGPRCIFDYELGFEDLFEYFKVAKELLTVEVKPIEGFG